jgi:HSP20 family protein
MNIIRYRRYPQPEYSSAFDRLANLREEMDRVFDTSFGSFLHPVGSFRSWAPALDVYQGKDHFTVVVELPGMRKEDLEISLHGDALTISGSRQREQKAEQEYRTERFVGKFQRTVTLPSAVDPNSVKASYRDGILQVTLQKAEEAKPKQIEVSAS